MSVLCPECGAPVSSSTEDVYCAELCGWSQLRHKPLLQPPWERELIRRMDDPPSPRLLRVHGKPYTPPRPKGSKR